MSKQLPLECWNPCHHSECGPVGSHAGAWTTEMLRQASMLDTGLSLASPTASMMGSFAPASEEDCMDSLLPPSPTTSMLAGSEISSEASPADHRWNLRSNAVLPAEQQPFDRPCVPDVIRPEQCRAGSNQGIFDPSKPATIARSAAMSKSLQVEEQPIMVQHDSIQSSSAAAAAAAGQSQFAGPWGDSYVDTDTAQGSFLGTPPPPIPSHSSPQSPAMGADEPDMTDDEYPSDGHPALVPDTFQNRPAGPSFAPQHLPRPLAHSIQSADKPEVPAAELLLPAANPDRPAPAASPLLQAQCGDRRRDPSAADDLCMLDPDMTQDDEDGELAGDTAGPDMVHPTPLSHMHEANVDMLHAALSPALQEQPDHAQVDRHDRGGCLHELMEGPNPAQDDGHQHEANLDVLPAVLSPRMQERPDGAPMTCHDRGGCLHVPVEDPEATQDEGPQPVLEAGPGEPQHLPLHRQNRAGGDQVHQNTQIGSCRGHDSSQLLQASPPTPSWSPISLGDGSSEWVGQAPRIRTPVGTDKSCHANLSAMISADACTGRSHWDIAAEREAKAASQNRQAHPAAEGCSPCPPTSIPLRSAAAPPTPKLKKRHKLHESSDAPSPPAVQGIVDKENLQPRTAAAASSTHHRTGEKRHCGLSGSRKGSPWMQWCFGTRSR